MPFFSWGGEASAAEDGPQAGVGSIAAGPAVAAATESSQRLSVGSFDQTTFGNESFSDVSPFRPSLSTPEPDDGPARAFELDLSPEAGDSFPVPLDASRHHGESSESSYDQVSGSVPIPGSYESGGGGAFGRRQGSLGHSTSHSSTSDARSALSCSPGSGGAHSLGSGWAMPKFGSFTEIRPLNNRKPSPVSGPRAAESVETPTGLVLRPGERLVSSEDGICLEPEPGMVGAASEPSGAVHLTNYRLVVTATGTGSSASSPFPFSPPAAGGDAGEIGPPVAAVALSCIESLATDESTGILLLVCKDVRAYRLRLADPSRLGGVAASIRDAVPLAPPHGIGAFGREGVTPAPRPGLGVADFDRQGVPWDKWRHTSQNTSHELCGTYPSHGLVVPAAVADTDLIAAAAFRAHRRFPALSYYHSPTGASLTRASQPLVGVTGGRNAKDENLLRAVYDNNMNGTDLHIIDCRSLPPNAHAQHTPHRTHTSTHARPSSTVSPCCCAPRCQLPLNCFGPPQEPDGSAREPARPRGWVRSHPELNLKTPAWVFCMSWCADFEFRVAQGRVCRPWLRDLRHLARRHAEHPRSRGIVHRPVRPLPRGPNHRAAAAQRRLAQ